MTRRFNKLRPKGTGSGLWTTAFYAAVAPEAAVWPLPSWIWDNRVENGTYGSGPYEANYTKCWMQELGVKKNYVLLKDPLFTA